MNSNKIKANIFQGSITLKVLPLSILFDVLFSHNPSLPLLHYAQSHLTLIWLLSHTIILLHHRVQQPLPLSICHLQSFVFPELFFQIKSGVEDTHKSLGQPPFKILCVHRFFLSIILILTLFFFVFSSVLYSNYTPSKCYSNSLDMFQHVYWILRFSLFFFVPKWNFLRFRHCSQCLLIDLFISNEYRICYLR